MKIRPTTVQTGVERRRRLRPRYTPPLKWPPACGALSHFPHLGCPAEKDISAN